MLLFKHNLFSKMHFSKLNKYKIRLNKIGEFNSNVNFKNNDFNIIVNNILNKQKVNITSHFGVVTNYTSTEDTSDDLPENTSLDDMLNLHNKTFISSKTSDDIIQINKISLINNENENCLEEINTKYMFPTSDMFDFEIELLNE